MSIPLTILLGVISSLIAAGIVFTFKNIFARKSNPPPASWPEKPRVLISDLFEIEDEKVNRGASKTLLLGRKIGWLGVKIGAFFTLISLTGLLFLGFIYGPDSINNDDTFMWDNYFGNGFFTGVALATLGGCIFVFFPENNS